MKRTIKIAAFLLVAGVAVAWSGTNDRTPEPNRQEAGSVTGNTKPYVILAEYNDAKGMKLYMANNLRKDYMDDVDFFDTTYLIVFNMQTKKKDTLATFESASFVGSGFIDFYHFEKGKLYFTETAYRGGNFLSYVNVNTDKVKLVDSGIETDENGESKIRVENGVIYYSKWICINENEAQYECDKEYVSKKYSIRI